ncbi:MAG: cytochrome c [Chitinophagaceae bacterium]|nr:MAG: cytochrome c [Chitinophagaceae bacterium]
MKKLIRTTGIAACCLFVFSCGSGNNDSNAPATESAAPATTDAGGGTNTTTSSNPKGVGPVTDVKLNNPLDQKMVASGKSVYEVKCASCHKLTDEKLVGPGWKGVTDRRTPEWIMNFVMNTEEMLNKDAEAQKMLEVCMVRMPNQSLTETDARAVLEYMLSNDGKK